MNKSLEPVDETDLHTNTSRTKLHRFLRIQDDLNLLNERLIHVSERSLHLLSGDHLRMRNDFKLVSERLNSMKRIVKIYLERMEKILAKVEVQETFSLTNLPTLRSSNSNLYVKKKSK